MPIKMTPIEQINPAGYNPRVKLTPKDREYQQLKTSIEKFGLVEPLIVNTRTGMLVGGHQRLTVMKDTGMELVPVVEIDVDETKEKQLNVALNRLKGRWDNKKLAETLMELTAAEAGEASGILEATGFNQNDIDDVLRRADAESAQSVLDRLLFSGPDTSDMPVDLTETGAEKSNTSGPSSSTGTTDQTLSKYFSHAVSVRVEDQKTIITTLEEIRKTENLETPAEAFVWLINWWADTQGED
jgi:hypothetical protein